jgi:hypothetical protein
LLNLNAVSSIDTAFLFMQGRALTTVEKAKFIQKLISTGGNVSRACQAINISRGCAYDHKKNDTDFAALWEQAVEKGLDDLEQEARRRAFKGTKKPVYQKGTCVGYIQEYSDTLLIFLLKGGRPEKYRERFEVNSTVQGSLDVNIEFEIDRIYNDEPDEDKAGLPGDVEAD